MSENSDVDSTAEQAYDPIRLPQAEEERTFEAPWQARAFATVVVLHREGVFEWGEFQAQLIGEIQDHSADRTEEETQTDYYDKWLTAAEDLLREKGIVDGDTLEQRTEEFLTGERDASEFVIGVEHAHTHHYDHD